MRVILTVVVPLLLPTALYLLWAAAFRRATPAEAAASWWAGPWTWLIVAGVALAAVMLVLLVETSGGGKGTYVPPSFVNGRIVPGHIVPDRRN